MAVQILCVFRIQLHNNVDQQFVSQFPWVLCLIISIRYRLILIS